PEVDRARPAVEPEQDARFVQGGMTGRLGGEGPEPTRERQADPGRKPEAQQVAATRQHGTRPLRSALADQWLVLNSLELSRAQNRLASARSWPFASPAASARYSRSGPRSSSRGDRPSVARYSRSTRPASSRNGEAASVRRRGLVSGRV